jgi:4-amino-4-deoxy-L-arabinose transferase-like glycosyltransferase
MEACLIEPEAVTKSNPPQARLSAAGWVGFALAATLCVGVFWRLVRFGAGFPIWGDEAMLLLNVLDRSYLELTHHLRFAQVAPLFFLWLEKTALVLFGSSEWSMHLFPFAAGLAALGLFWHVCRTHFSPTVAGLAVAILAVSYYPVRHGAEVKPYSFDLLFAITFAWLTLGQRRDAQSWRWLAGLAVVAPLAVFSSYPSAFVGGAVSLVLLPRLWQATNVQRSLWVLFNLLLCGAFVVHYAFVGRVGADAAAAERSHEFLLTYWKEAFPPDSIAAWPWWLVKVLTGNMLAYPIGAHSGGSTLTFVLVLLGVVALWRGGSRWVVALCLLPFALTLVAAIVHRYPFGGSARITLHLAPFICILMAHGVEQALAWVRSDTVRQRCHLVFMLFLLGCGIVGVTRDLLKPYKTIHDRDMRQLVLDLRAKVQEGEPVLLCHTSDEHVQAEFTWYLRAQTWQLEYLANYPLDASTKSAWLIMSDSRSEPSVDAALARLGSNRADWAVDQSDVRFVPPENDVMSPIHVRWVRIVRVSR